MSFIDLLFNLFSLPLVDGGLSEWSAWGTCSKDCGNGTRTRTRNCTNPSPQYGGKNCTDLGDTQQEEDCCLGKVYPHPSYQDPLYF